MICPAALRKQWATELAEKFHLPVQVLDKRTWNDLRKQGIYDPLSEAKLSIVSYNFAAAMEQQLRTTPWDLVVIDEQLFGDAISFRSMFMRNGYNIAGLRSRLAEFTRRTLRRDVLEYVRYTERKPITIPFAPGVLVERLYDLVSAYLQRDESYGVPHRQRHLVSMVIRKLLASSTTAVIRTLESMLTRLRKLEQYLELANSIPEDAKSHGLLQALQLGFSRMDEMGATPPASADL